MHVASADDHELTDAEISDDARLSATTYPPHCLRGTRGARKIPETEQDDPVPIPLELAARAVPRRPGVPAPEEDRRRLHEPEHGPSSSTGSILTEIVVFGVATDVCDDAAIRGFWLEGSKVRFVEDAARGLDDERVAICTAFWREQGVEFTTAEVVRRDLLG